jgi:hemolysin activation/secretion protein
MDMNRSRTLPQCLLVSVLLLSPAVLYAAEPAAATTEPDVLRFDITSFTVEGSSLLTQSEIDVAVAPFIGKGKDFSDVQRALEAVEELYAKHGYTAVRVLLPEQELEKGRVRFRAVENRIGQVAVKGQQHFSEESVRRALPSLRQGGVPNSRKIARELKLANENPARLLNVVMKAAPKDEMDAEVRVNDLEPASWGVSFDNTGSTETGRTRLGLFYRHANLMDADHVGMLQLQVSPQHMNRVRVFGGSYKVPLYESGNSVEFFGGYSNVNSVVGGLTNFQGGGVLLNARYNQILDKMAGFDPRLSYGFDWRDFKRIEQTQPTSAVLYNEIVVTPLSLSLTAQDRQERGETNLDLGLFANVPLSGKGKKEQFAAYDPLGQLNPDANYRIVRYGANHLQVLGQDWQARALLTGQWTRNVLILGEQMRLGGMNAVRGFSEGSEAGESGARWSFEGYSPATTLSGIAGRALLFYDGGSVHSKSGLQASIRSYGLGLRASWQQVSFRLDAGRIAKAGTDPLQKKGDWRMHASISATF